MHDTTQTLSTRLGRTDLRCFLLIFLCFFLTSAGYLSWLYHLMEFVSPKAADTLTMGGGYTLQAAGIGLFALLIHRHPRSVTHGTFFLSLLLYLVCTIPALLSHSQTAVICFGLLGNVFCGLIAAFYLYILTFAASERMRAVLFGTGYAAATIAAWLLSLAGNDNFLASRYILLVYVALVFLTAALIRRLPFDIRTERPVPKPVSGMTRLPILAAGTILLFSLVKNLGFGFPSADILSGISMETSRLFYAAGLIIAGFITAKNQKYGAVCTIAALITPFLVLSLSGEPVSQTIFWALDYFIFAFFSVYRILLFSDLARKYDRPFASGFGLLFGRIGDVAGTLLGILLVERASVLITLAALLFVLAVFIFFRLYQLLYAPAAPSRLSEKERFDAFSIQYSLSSREQEVLQMLLEKKASSEIADTLFISERTVKFHIHNLLTKTGCTNRTDLLKLFREETRNM